MFNHFHFIASFTSITSCHNSVQHNLLSHIVWTQLSPISLPLPLSSHSSLTSFPLVHLISTGSYPVTTSISLLISSSILPSSPSALCLTSSFPPSVLLSPAASLYLCFLILKSSGPTSFPSSLWIPAFPEKDFVSLCVHTLWGPIWVLDLESEAILVKVWGMKEM